MADKKEGSGGIGAKFKRKASKKTGSSSSAASSPMDSHAVASGGAKSATLPSNCDAAAAMMQQSHSEGLFSRIKRRFRIGSRGKYDFHEKNVRLPRTRRKSDEPFPTDGESVGPAHMKRSEVVKTQSVRTQRKVRSDKEEVFLIRKNKKVSVFCKSENGTPEVIFSNVDNSDDSSEILNGNEEDPYATINSLKCGLISSHVSGAEGGAAEGACFSSLPPCSSDDTQLPSFIKAECLPSAKSPNGDDCPYARIDSTKKNSKQKAVPVEQGQRIKPDDHDVKMRVEAFNTHVKARIHSRLEPEYETLDEVNQRKSEIELRSSQTSPMSDYSRTTENLSCSDRMSSSDMEPDYESLEEVKLRISSNLSTSHGDVKSTVPPTSRSVSLVVGSRVPNLTSDHRSSLHAHPPDTCRVFISTSESDPYAEIGEVAEGKKPSSITTRSPDRHKRHAQHGDKSTEGCGAGIPSERFSTPSPRMLAPLAPCIDSSLDQPPTPTDDLLTSPEEEEDSIYDNPNVILRKQSTRLGLDNTMSYPHSRRSLTLHEPPTLKTPAEEELVEKLSLALAPPLPLRNYQKEETLWRGSTENRGNQACRGAARHSWAAQVQEGQQSRKVGMRTLSPAFLRNYPRSAENTLMKPGRKGNSSSKSHEELSVKVNNCALVPTHKPGEEHALAEPFEGISFANLSYSYHGPGSFFNRSEGHVDNGAVSHSGEGLLDRQVSHGSEGNVNSNEVSHGSEGNVNSNEVSHGSEGNVNSNEVSHGSEGNVDSKEVSHGSEGNVDSKEVSHGSEGNVDSKEVSHDSEGNVDSKKVSHGSEGNVDSKEVSHGSEGNVDSKEVSHGSEGNVDSKEVSHGSEGNVDSKEVSHGSEGNVDSKEVSHGSEGNVDSNEVSHGGEGNVDSKEVSYGSEGNVYSKEVSHCSEGSVHIQPKQCSQALSEAFSVPVTMFESEIEPKKVFSETDASNPVKQPKLCDESGFEKFCAELATEILVEAVEGNYSMRKGKEPTFILDSVQDKKGVGGTAHSFQNEQQGYFFISESQEQGTETSLGSKSTESFSSKSCKSSENSSFDDSLHISEGLESPILGTCQPLTLTQTQCVNSSRTEKLSHPSDRSSEASIGPDRGCADTAQLLACAGAGAAVHSEYRAYVQQGARPKARPPVLPVLTDKLKSTTKNGGNKKDMTARELPQACQDQEGDVKSVGRETPSLFCPNQSHSRDHRSIEKGPVQLCQSDPDHEYAGRGMISQSCQNKLRDYKCVEGGLMRQCQGHKGDHECVERGLPHSFQRNRASHGCTHQESQTHLSGGKVDTRGPPQLLESYIPDRVGITRGQTQLCESHETDHECVERGPILPRESLMYIEGGRRQPHGSHTIDHECVERGLVQPYPNHVFMERGRTCFTQSNLRDHGSMERGPTLFIPNSSVLRQVAEEARATPPTFPSPAEGEETVVEIIPPSFTGPLESHPIGRLLGSRFIRYTDDDVFFLSRKEKQDLFHYCQWLQRSEPLIRKIGLIEIPSFNVEGYIDSDSTDSEDQTEEPKLKQFSYNWGHFCVRKTFVSVFLSSPRLLENSLSQNFNDQLGVDIKYLERGVFKWSRYYDFSKLPRAAIESKLRSFFHYLRHMLVSSWVGQDDVITKNQERADERQQTIEHRLSCVQNAPTFQEVKRRLSKSIRALSNRNRSESQGSDDSITSRKYIDWAGREYEDDFLKQLRTKSILGLPEDYLMNRPREGSCQSSSRMLAAEHQENVGHEPRSVKAMGCGQAGIDGKSDSIVTSPNRSDDIATRSKTLKLELRKNQTDSHVLSNQESKKELLPGSASSKLVEEFQMLSTQGRMLHSGPRDPRDNWASRSRDTACRERRKGQEGDYDSDSEDEMMTMEHYSRIMSYGEERKHLIYPENTSLCRMLHGELAYSMTVRPHRALEKDLLVEGPDEQCQGLESHVTFATWCELDQLCRKLVSHISPRLDFQFLLKTYEEFKHFVLEVRKKKYSQKGCYVRYDKCCRFEEFIFLKLLRDEIRHFSGIISGSATAEALFREEKDIGVTLLQLLSLVLKNLAKMKNSQTRERVRGSVTWNPSFPRPPDPVADHPIAFRHSGYSTWVNEVAVMDATEEEIAFHKLNHVKFFTSNLSLTLREWVTPHDVYKDPNILSGGNHIYAEMNSRPMEAIGIVTHQIDYVKPLHEREDFLESMQQLQLQEWYWGPISYEQAALVLKDKEDGSFLVRDSSDRKYLLSLSFKSLNEVHHTRIEHAKGLFSFWSQPESHGKARICEFIEKSVQNSKDGRFLYFLRPSGQGTPPLPIRLLTPVSRNFRVASLKHLSRFVVRQAVRKDHIDQLPVPLKVKSYLLENQYYVEVLAEDQWAFDNY